MGPGRKVLVAVRGSCVEKSFRFQELWLQHRCWRRAMGERDCCKRRKRRTIEMRADGYLMTGGRLAGGQP